MGFSDEGGLVGRSDGPWKPFRFRLNGFRIKYFLGTLDRCLHPASGGRGMWLYDSAVADVSVSQCAT